jgi:Tol biopolymer transport system component
VSADGRLVVFAGPPTAADDPRTSTVYLRDRALGTTIELTEPLDAIRSGDSVMPVISADGCAVAVVTEFAYDLFRDDDTGERWDVYLERLPSCGGTLGDWSLVSTDLGSGFDAGAADDVSPLYPPAITAEGATVAYTQRFGLDAPELTRVTVADLTMPLGDPGRTLAVYGTPIGEPTSVFRYRGVREPSISDDGSVLAVTSDVDLVAREWGEGDRPGDFATSHVYVWDRTQLDPALAMRRVSGDANSDGDAGSPVVSGDGNTVAFVSASTDLVAGADLPPCTPACRTQVYVLDRPTGLMRLASRVPGDPTQPGVGADMGAWAPSLTRTGAEVAFVTRSTNLFPTRSADAGELGDGDIVVAVPATGEARRLSVLPDGVTPAPAANANPKLSAHGRVLVFDTLAGAAFGGTNGKGRQLAMIDRRPDVSLSDLDLGTVVVGFPGPEWYLVVENHGPASFVPALTSVDNPDFLVSGGSCVDRASTPVPPGGTCTVNLMFMPSKPGPAEARLTVHEYGFGATSVSSTLHGFGGEPALAPTPAGADTGDVEVGAVSEPVSYGVFNIAFTLQTIRSIEVRGRDALDFRVSLDQCTGNTLEASKGCIVQVQFAPTASGRRSASIVATADDGVYTTMLVSGRGHWKPAISVAEPVVLSPSRMEVTGGGFGPNAAVTFAWADGSGRGTTTVSDGYGQVKVQLIVPPGSRPGPRTLVAQTSDGLVATTTVNVRVRGSQSGANSPRWPGA